MQILEAASDLPQKVDGINVRAAACSLAQGSCQQVPGKVQGCWRAARCHTLSRKPADRRSKATGRIAARDIRSTPPTDPADLMHAVLGIALAQAPGVEANLAPT